MKIIESILYRRMMTCGILFAGMLAVSCSREPMAQQREREREQAAVSFEAYTSRAVTRAGASGELASARMKSDVTSHGLAGFGVFGYYTGNGLLHGTYQPNFMYNQQVVYRDEHWTYSPLKYWPNEFGDEQSEEIDHVSFFAYAPYVDVIRSSGMLNTGNTVLEAQRDTLTGIVALSALADFGDPLVHYVVNPTPGSGVDLCWGTAADHPDDNDGSATDLKWGNPSAPITVRGGFPWLNLTRPANVNDRVKLVFRHATSQLNVRVTGPQSFTTPGNTRIYIREVTFTGFAMEGALNLNNTTKSTPLWTGYDEYGRLSREPVTFYDGRLDGYEGRFSDPGELLKGINPVLIQDTVWGDDHQTSGVDNQTRNLFASANTDTPLYVIPNGVPLSLTVVYDVETRDNLPGVLSDGSTAGISIENRTTVAVHIFNRDTILEAGKSYILLLDIDLTGLRFDLSIQDNWAVCEEDID